MSTRTRFDSASIGILGCLGLILLVLALWAIGAAFWGWLIMLGAGILGYNLPFWPDALGLGFIFSAVVGAISGPRVNQK